MSGDAGAVRPPLVVKAAAAVVLVALVGSAAGVALTRGHGRQRSPAARPTRVVAAGCRVPPPVSRTNVYAATAAGLLSRVVRHDPALVYVPNSLSGTVDVISQRTLRIIRSFPVARRPQHVVPSYDLKTPYVVSDLGNSLQPIDPLTGRPNRGPVPVADPYNMYFTPDGCYAITVAELLKRLDFRDPHTMALRFSLRVPTCPGVDHADFSADGRFM